MTLIKGEPRQSGQAGADSSDPVLAMLGVGRQLWADEPGDQFVERLRQEESAPGPAPEPATIPRRDLNERIWRCIQQHEGEEFRTARGLPMRYKMEGSGIWFYREGRRINRKLGRSQVEEAISRCPLRSTTEINDLMDYPYLFALLTDPRIKGEAW